MIALALVIATNRLRTESVKAGCSGKFVKSFILAQIPSLFDAISCRGDEKIFGCILKTADRRPRDHVNFVSQTNQLPYPRSHFLAGSRSRKLAACTGVPSLLGPE